MNDILDNIASVMCKVNEILLRNNDMLKEASALVEQDTKESRELAATISSCVSAICNQCQLILMDAQNKINE